MVETWSLEKELIKLPALTTISCRRKLLQGLVFDPFYSFLPQTLSSSGDVSMKYFFSQKQIHRACKFTV